MANTIRTGRSVGTDAVERQPADQRVASASKTLLSSKFVSEEQWQIAKLDHSRHFGGRCRAAKNVKVRTE